MLLINTLTLTLTLRMVVPRRPHTYSVHYITLQTIYSGLSKSNFKDHYGDTATQQCLGMIAEINEFSVSDETENETHRPCCAKTKKRQGTETISVAWGKSP